MFTILAFLDSRIVQVTPIVVHFIASDSASTQRLRLTVDAGKEEYSGRKAMQSVVVSVSLHILVDAVVQLVIDFLEIPGNVPFIDDVITSNLQETSLARNEVMCVRSNAP